MKIFFKEELCNSPTIVKVNCYWDHTTHGREMWVQNFVWYTSLKTATWRNALSETILKWILWNILYFCETYAIVSSIWSV